MSTHLSLTGLSPSLAGFPKTVLLNSLNQFRGPNPSMHARWFGLFRFRSPLLTESHVVFSSSGYLDVSVHRVPFLKLCIGLRILEVCSSRFPHSEISGSKDICSSPKLFAAYHVFHRLLVPRHPPCALYSLTKRLSSAGADYSSKIHSVVSLVLGYRLMLSHDELHLLFGYIFRCNTSDVLNMFFFDIISEIHVF